MVKKYFYILRPILACMWVEKRNEAPPMEFEKLLYNLDLDESLVEKINVLLERKRAGVEMGLEPKIDEINRFIEEKIVYFEKNTEKFNPNKKPDSKILHEYFVRILREGDVTH